MCVAELPIYIWFESWWTFSNVIRFLSLARLILNCFSEFSALGLRFATLLFGAVFVLYCLTFLAAEISCALSPRSELVSPLEFNSRWCFCPVKEAQKGSSSVNFMP